MWQRAGAIDPPSLWDARLQLHWAAQPAAGVGRRLLPKQADYSQESFSWSCEHGALLQGVVSAPRPVRAGIQLRGLTLLILDDCGVTVDSLPMNGRTLGDGFAFFEQLFGTAIARPPEGMPAHAVARGAAFNAIAAHLEELERYYAGASAVLANIAARESGAGPVRCWPHHLDMASLIALGGSGEDARTIGVGMAPGDASYGEPYYYVTPWPYPPPESLPLLDAGSWNTTGWVGAVLRAGDFLPASDQQSMIESFLAEAIGHCRSLIG
ncbi:MAG TPA: hypothetical protein VEZ11_06295 [Thermoanaerobaculia bacterium]|nr:hypothetical protein [Thermoanaerobaculia bacterium]